MENLERHLVSRKERINSLINLRTIHNHGYNLPACSPHETSEGGPQWEIIAKIVAHNLKMTKNPLLLFLIFASVHCTAQDLLESVPIQFVENYIFIEVTINDTEKPLNFLFDTGAGITVVDTKVAEQLSLDINAQSKISTSGKSLLSKESISNIVTIGKNIHSRQH